MIQRILLLNRPIIALVLFLMGLSFVLLYDAGGGHLDPWANAQFLRCLLGFFLMIFIALTPLSFWIKSAYVFYFISLFLLILVNFVGHVGMGAQRWLNLGVIKIQPSELMRIALILSLACYFHRRSVEEIRSLKHILPAVLMILFPCILILKQPDLGTTIPLLATGAFILFWAGVPRRYFLVTIGLVITALPIIWKSLHNYQKDRILIFLDPEKDPFGAGYHILQSKIALGSGGFFGKGFLQGTQSHLNFLPEKQTDFIFTLFAEEFGFLGSLFLVGIYGLLIALCFFVGMRCLSPFSRLLALGLTATLFFYCFINIAMVTGLLPVVGIPLPFLSYGGTAMWTLLMSIGFILNADLNRSKRFDRYY